MNCKSKKKVESQKEINRKRGGRKEGGGVKIKSQVVKEKDYRMG